MTNGPTDDGTGDAAPATDAPDAGAQPDAPVALPDAAPTPCTVTLTGAVTGSFPCTASLSYLETSDRTSLTIIAEHLPAPFDAPNAGVHLYFARPGRPALGPWLGQPDGSDSVQCSVEEAPLADGGRGPMWETLSTPKYTLTLTRVVLKAHIPSVDAYALSGSLTTAIPRFASGDPAASPVGVEVAF